LKRFCNNTTDITSLIEGVFTDITLGNDLSDFKISKELRKGMGSAIVDTIILEPNISGVGFSFNRLKSYC